MKMNTAELVVFGRFISVLMFSFGLQCVTSSKDLALHKNAHQSSTYGSYGAGRAVDGTPGGDVRGGHCSHTNDGNHKAWWKVDLGQMCRIQTINITYRHDYTRRLYGYYLYVTNHTEMAVNSNGNINSRLGHLCYHDNGSALPNYFQSRPCPIKGSYVIFYNKRPIVNTAHPSTISDEAYIELCEVQVFGCPVNYFGPDCSSECHCMMGGCNPDTGQCDVSGCQSGWKGTSCSETCEAGRFGANCTFACHCQDGSCNSSTGICHGEGCVEGWNGPRCYTAANDLAFMKPTNQSSVNDATTSVYDSNNAVDGLPIEGSCSHTFPRAYIKAWWKVDLQTIYRINTIKLVFTQKHRSIIRGYYLYVSNASDTDSFSQAYMCFHDETTSTNPLPSYITSHPCSVNGRYVIVYNDRPYYRIDQNNPHQKYASTEAVVELCDVQVLGCLPNHFGANCNSTCHCKIGGCLSDTGLCDVPGCQDGWTAENCSVCGTNHFGPDCTQQCHCKTEGCNRIDGTCNVTGCQDGWTGKSCDQKCPAAHFGLQCSEVCHCQLEGCDHINGKCQNVGCQAGWSGQACTHLCDTNHFGPDCTQQCHCKTEGCNRINGTCNVTGCQDGWTGKSCDQMCDRNHFGPDCTQQCHCKTEGCNRINGTCNVTGCQDGWMGKSCDQMCDRNHFGPNCTQQCHCKTEGCNRINGTCNVTGCQDGWTGKSCDQVCDTNHFGPDCTEQCHCKTEGCSRIDGTCNVTGCQDGWKGKACDQMCDTDHFGPNCTQQCHCKTDGCNRIDGTCNATGCQDGWMGKSCDQVCDRNHFGPNCTQQCHCKTDGCNRIDGTCNATGCQDGWMGKSCDQVCDRNHFGPNCTQQCHCKTEGCNRINGTCNVTGCQDGWMGKSCDQRQSETSSESSPSSGALIGGVVAAVVALLVVIVIVVVVRKRQIPSEERPVGDNDLSPENQHSIKRENVYVNISPKNTKKKKPYEVKTPKVIETDIDEDEVIYVNGPHDEDVRGETKLLVADLKEIVKTKHENDMYEVEFKSLPHGLKHPHSNAKLEQNLLRNRFKTTFPYDHSRVVLKKEKKGSTDYINANYIDGVRNKKTYIATQGPKTMTLEEFWRMAWQNNCGKIVMLANLIEVGKVKCATYWTGSEGNSLELDLFQVTLQEEVAYAFYTTRKLVVKNKQTNRTRQISQYHFTRWPDHGVPEPFELLQFYKRVKDDRTNHKGPLIVHCSAGIGRTGTFIGLDALLLEGNTSGEIDVFAYTEKMRKDRMNMIQTADQYAMLHDVLLEGLTVVTSSMSKTDFSRSINDMCDKDIPTQQYSLLNSARPEYSTTEYSTAIENKEKNRNQSILAVEKYTIRLRTTAKEYINAVNIPGYRIPYGYILTQHPLDNTVIDFLSLISQERSDTVVSIGRLQNNPCWPTKQGSVAKFGNFVVTNVHCDHHAVGPKRVEERQLTIVNKEIGADTKISLLETPSWGRSMPNSSFMLELIQIIQSRRGIDAPPVIITCSDGATESGLLCTLCNVMERLVVDGDVDIMAAARQLQIRRPQCFPNKDQYVFCYNLVKEHLEESSVYANV